jgi:AcrR family transcriptional regulator
MKARACSREDKAGRRQAILTAAHAVWLTSTFDTLTMATVAKRAALAKGTLYLYFPTKEALLLALLESRLDQCFPDVERSLEAAGVVTEPERLAEVIVTVLLRDQALTRLLAILGTILEQNIPPTRIRRFKAWMLQRMASAGEAFERRMPFLRRGGGLRLLLDIQILVAGISQMAEPTPMVARVLAQPEFEPLRIDFATELRDMLAALLRGRAERARRPRASAPFKAQPQRRT